MKYEENSVKFSKTMHILHRFHSKLVSSGLYKHTSLNKQTHYLTRESAMFSYTIRSFDFQLTWRVKEQGNLVKTIYPTCRSSAESMADRKPAPRMDERHVIIYRNWQGLVERLSSFFILRL